MQCPDSASACIPPTSRLNGSRDIVRYDLAPPYVNSMPAINIPLTTVRLQRLCAWRHSLWSEQGLHALFLPPPRPASELPHPLLLFHDVPHPSPLYIRSDKSRRLLPHRRRMEPRSVVSREMHHRQHVLLHHVDQRDHDRYPLARTARSNPATATSAEDGQTRTGGHVHDGVSVSVSVLQSVLVPRLISCGALPE